MSLPCLKDKPCRKYGFSGLALTCLLYTSDAADERSSVDLGGRRIIKKKNKASHGGYRCIHTHKEQPT